jgi:hypothetical protein
MVIILHSPPSTPSATSPKVRPLCLIFQYKMFFFPSFHVPHCTMTRYLDFRSKGIETLPHFHHYRRKLAWASTPSFQLVLSLSSGGLLLCSLATNNSAIKTVGEGAANAGTLSWTPDGLRCTPCRQGLSPRRAAGKVAKGPE